MFLYVNIFQYQEWGKLNLENTEIQADEDKSPPDEVTSKFSSIDTATPNVSQDVNLNTTVVLMPSDPQDTKL